MLDWIIWLWKSHVCFHVTVTKIFCKLIKHPDGEDADDANNIGDSKSIIKNLVLFKKFTYFFGYLTWRNFKGQLFACSLIG
jgi:hypothetical protein